MDTLTIAVIAGGAGLFAFCSWMGWLAVAECVGEIVGVVIESLFD